MPLTTYARSLCLSRLAEVLITINTWSLFLSAPLPAPLRPRKNVQCIHYEWSRLYWEMSNTLQSQAPSSCFARCFVSFYHRFLFFLDTLLVYWDPVKSVYQCFTVPLLKGSHNYKATKATWVMLLNPGSGEKSWEVFAKAFMEGHQKSQNKLSKITWKKRCAGWVLGHGQPWTHAPAVGRFQCFPNV